MTALQTEWRRLYLCADTATPNPADDTAVLITADGRARAMVLELARPADWPVMSTVWQRVQTELELPAPAIAINGHDGYQLWFSLAEPVSLAQAQQFLECLRLRYLAEIPPQRARLLPTADQHPDPVPALQAATGMWSAFVAPDLAALFADSPGLDVCPSPEAQAKVLSALASIQPAVFASALARMTPKAAPTPVAASDPPAQPASLSTAYRSDPKGFLQDVMNDPRIALPLRIEAAKALLPYS